jgi:hypothetical protein
MLYSNCAFQAWNVKSESINSNTTLGGGIVKAQDTGGWSSIDQHRINGLVDSSSAYLCSPHSLRSTKEAVSKSNVMSGIVFTFFSGCRPKELLVVRVTDNVPATFFRCEG